MSNTIPASFLLPVMIAAFAGCSNQQKTIETGESNRLVLIGTDKAPVFEKMLGTWQNTRNKSFERWTKTSTGYLSVVFSITGKDTAWKEQANVYIGNDKWVFENKVRGQNAGKAIKFTSSFITESSVQFSNPSHDFPTDINYTVINANTLNAFIAGPNSAGGRDTIPFRYKRYNP